MTISDKVNLPASEHNSEEMPSFLDEGSVKKTKINNNEADKEFQDLLELFRGKLISERGATSWDSIIGARDVKETLQIKLILPKLYPQFQNKGTLGNNVLFFGPPGCGKTNFGKAMATKFEAKFLPIQLSNVLSKWKGQGEKSIRAFFSVARENKPCVIFIDEIEPIIGARSDTTNGGAGKVTEFLTQMDGVNHMISNEGVYVLAATNYLWLIDEAALLRFGTKIYVGLPSKQDHPKMLIYFLRNISGLRMGFMEEDLQLVGKLTERYSGSDLKLLAYEMADFRWVKTKSARYFCKFQAYDADISNKLLDLWAPCSLGDGPGTISTWFTTTASGHTCEAHSRSNQ